MSLIDLNMMSILIDELNAEIRYQVSGGEDLPMYLIKNFLTLQSDGSDHTVFFLGSKIFSTKDEKETQQIPLELELELNSKENVESFLRNLIQTEVRAICHIDLLNIKV